MHEPRCKAQAQASIHALRARADDASVPCRPARRRAALGLAAAAALGLLARAAASVAATPGDDGASDGTAKGDAATIVKPLDPSAQIKRPIPGTAERIPIIGLGTWQSFDVAGDGRGLADARESLRLFAASGGRVIDSSPMYGSSETVVGDLAAALGLEGRLFIATKVWTTGKAQGVQQMEESAARMRAQPIDLMQIHNLVDWRTQVTTLRAWKAEGRIRYWGFTHYTQSSHRELAALMRAEKPDFVQIDYSIRNRDVERELLPLAQAQHIGVLVNQPFESGRLFGVVKGMPVPPWAADFDCSTWAQFFLKFIVSHPAVTCAIPATRNPRFLVDNMQAGAGRLPDARMRERMAAHVASL